MLRKLTNMHKMRTTPRRKASLILVAALLAALAVVRPEASAGPADRLDDIRRRQQELGDKIERADQRRGDILDEIKAVDAERAEAEDVVHGLDAELARLNGRIEEVTVRLERTQQRLAIVHSELEDILDRLVTRTDLFAERAVAAYKAGPAAYLDGLVTSESFGDLVERYSYYRSVLDADTELLEEIEALRAETDARRRQVEEKEQQIAVDKRRLEADRERVAEVRSAKAQALAELDGVLGEKEGLLASVEAKKSRYESIQQQLDQESSELQRLLAARSAPSQPEPSAPAAPVSGGAFAWPAPGPVTSPFGFRVHPIFGDRRLHTGVDISAPYGATVIAAESGVVAYVGTMSGYGNVVAIDHGGGVATTYNHLSAFSVGSGQQVSRGTPVGAVGCTGYCTGPHLHFEVRLNGTPVDPMPYLQ
jgi:murein DD-endopeptidase MepM/ murein hydrolase activator NlpD